MMFVRFSILLSVFAFASSQQLKNLKENELCGENGARGLCKMVSNCATAIQIIKNGGRPPLCGFKGNQPLICCPDSLPAASPTSNSATRRPSTTANTFDRTSGHKSISEKMCEKYAKSVFEMISVQTTHAVDETINHCGWTAEQLIVGGKKALPKVFVHMALIGYGENKEWLCGGSLISEQYVLSAAHCNEVFKWGKAAWARLGDLDLSSSQDEADPRDYEIIERIVHPEYQKKLSYHDIVLFKLDINVEFTPYIRPICLHNTFNVDQPKVIVTGWGRIEFKGRFSSDLLQLRVDLVDPDSCKERFQKYERGKNSLIPQGVNNNSMICAGGVVGEDACQGDSGGPLQIPLTNPYCMFSQIGIVSFGNRCALGEPGVYTRVSNYIPWIESIVWPQT